MKKSAENIYDNNDGISIIVPFLNEEMTLPVFCDTMKMFVAGLPFPVEFVFVNDGSTDNSLKILQEYPFDEKTSVKVVNLSRNFGFHSAVRAGLINAAYDICTWFSADLQEPLEIIQIAYDKIHNENCEVVYFSKRTVGVSKLNRFCSKVYSHLMRKYAIKIFSSDGTATVAFGKKVKKILNENIERNSDIVLQVMDMGFKYESVPLDYHARTAGESKWSLSKKIKLFIDSFVAFSYMPIRLVSIVGILMLIIGFVAGFFTIINKILNPMTPAGYSTIVCVLVMGFGITNISLGIIAEYIWRTLDAARDRPVFIISDVIDL
ncbi:MAG: glycosyltransferase [Lachnospiraceae bacterium]|nr:glycosyltransferase [Lachnospiraceae bacterium]